jgi:hypothetical protein
MEVGVAKGACDLDNLYDRISGRRAAAEQMTYFRVGRRDDLICHFQPAHWQLSRLGYDLRNTVVAVIHDSELSGSRAQRLRGL